jgi:hypothetical protein
MWIATAMNACSQETLVPTHYAQLFVVPSRYGELIEKLDSALEASGLSRYAAAPGLNELRGRDVLYAEYRLHRSEKWAFLTATDVAKAGTVELRVYATVLSDPQNRKTAMSRLSSVLAEFGATLTAKTSGT